MTTFADRLLDVLDEKKLTRADLCRMTGLKSAHLVGYIKNPDRSPKLSTAVKIADALDVSIDWLAGRDGFDMHGKTDPKRGRQSPEVEKLVDDYSSTTPQWQRVISEQAANAAKEHPKTAPSSAERRTA